MKKNHFFGVTLAILFAHPSISQDRKFNYRIDNPNFTREYNLRAKKIEAIPGSSDFKLLSNFTGVITLSDQRPYTQFWELDSSLNPIANHFYLDTVFSFTPTATINDFCQDGRGNTYAVGSSKSDSKVIMKIAANGIPIWTRDVDNHQFSSVIYNSLTDRVLVLGQEEVPSYDHDMFLLELDTNGLLTNGLTYSYSGFDDAVKIIPMPSGYMILGAAAGNGKKITLISIDNGLNLKWANTYDNSLSVNPSISDMSLSEDQSQLLIGGYLRIGSRDSLFLLNVDTSGIPIYFKSYQTPSQRGTRVNSIKGLPGNDFLVGGSFLDTANLDQAFVMRVASDGSVAWSSRYENQFHAAEVVEDVLPLDSEFLAVSNLITIDTAGGSNSDQLSIIRASLVDGGNNCGSPLVVNVTDLTVIADTVNLIQIPNNTLNTYHNYIADVQQIMRDTLCFSIDSSAPPPDTTGIFESQGTSGDSFLLFPNPASDIVHVTYSGNIPVKEIAITLFNSVGQIIRQYGRFSNQHEPIVLDVSSFPSGIYTLILDEGGAQYYKKIILK